MPRKTIAAVAAALLAAVAVIVLTATTATSAPPNNPVVIANGWSPSDVGTAAPLAGSLGGSVLYAQRNGQSLGAPTVAALRQLKPSKVILVGGTAALTPAVVDEVRRVTGLAASKVERLAGSDRLDTAAKGALYTLGGPQQPTTSEAPSTDTSCPAGIYLHGTSDSISADADLRCANFSGTTLSGLNLENRDLRRANFSRATLYHNTEFDGADLRGANFSNARDAGRWQASFVGADLRDANLSGADLENDDFRQANLRGANLSGADLDGTNFASADLRGADLSGADLDGTNFASADLRNADLTNASNRQHANFAKAKTEGCNGCP